MVEPLAPFVAFDRTQGTVSGDVAGPLRACVAASPDVNNGKADTQCSAFNWQSGGDMRPAISEEHTSALSTTQVPAISNRYGVRRLMPIEAERLQGLPDGWTEGQSDTRRYRQLGNGAAVPVVEWFARRIVACSD